MRIEMNLLSEERKYYVYTHSLPGKGVFYVGRGFKYRATNMSNRGKFWKNKVKKYGKDAVIVTIISDKLTLEESNRIEQFWIAVYGRIKDRPDGVLVNICAGGDTTIGFRHSEESIRKMSEKHKGKVISEETKKKLSKARKGRKSTAYWSAESRAIISKSRKGHISPLRGTKKTKEQRDKESFSSRSFDFILLDKEGNEHVVRNRKEFADKHGMDYAGLSGLAHGRVKRYKGFVLYHHIPKE